MDKTTRSFGREVAGIAALAAPIIAGQLLTIAVNVIDTVLAGSLGRAVLAAVAMGYQIWIVALLAVIGVMLALTPTVAQLDGAGSRALCGHFFRQAMWLGLFLGLALCLALRAGADFFSMVGVDREIIPQAEAFLRAIAWGAPALAIFFACKNVSEGLSMTKPTMYFGLLGVIVLLPSAYGLMYGKWGLPRLGAAGAGAAHALVLWVEAIGFLVYLRWSKNYREAQLFSRFEWPEPATIWQLLKVGVPMGISILMEGSLFVAAALLAGRFGEVGAGAHAIAINIASVAFMIPLGLAMATTIRIGNAYGRQDLPAIALTFKAGLLVTFITQASSAMVMMIMPRALVSLYTDDAAVTTLAVQLLALAALFQFSDGFQAFFNGALRGIKDTFVPALATIVAYWGIGLPVSLWLGIHLDRQAPGLWWGLIAGLTVAAALLCARLLFRLAQYHRQGIPGLVAR